MKRLPAEQRALRPTRVRLVYVRELKARMFTRGYLVSLALLSLVTFGLVIGFNLIGRSTSATVAVCGTPAASLGTAPPGVRVTSCDDMAEAQKLVEDKDADAAVVVAGAHASLLVRADTGDQARAGAAALAETWAGNQALLRQKVDLGRLARDTAAAAPTTVTVGDSVGTLQLGAAASLIIILFMQVVNQGSVIAQGVVEEKSTRVVEVLLATLTPLELLVGKVSGIVTAGMVQVAAMLGAVMGAQSTISEQTIAMPAPRALVATVLWFLLTFAMFASLYAAAGSLASRPEDLQGVLTPVMLLALAPVGAATAAAAHLSASWVSVVQYIPPFSGLLIPLKASVGTATVQEQLAAAAILLVVTACCMTLAGRIYRNSVLRVGAPIRWRQALAA
ncbi:ABC transporter permease [Streptomyces thermodiastaticus]|uniref:ABC transporter permease n=1 Tax=Streptomyces thermodiastaticus TaxID=44061 RepID=UPI0016792391|nr:ABC transporter permease [Streptomyces thermodiastaticus]MCE7551665.1 ABC transporter permease [Streptomyces thermodiastaticus]GHF92688.1 ABC transporter permease [Streptomyces thermodiastaticus]